MADARPLPAVIGPTENALRALLARILSTTPIGTYPSWVVLDAIGRTGPGDSDWRPAVADGLKADLAQVERTLDDLRSAGLVGTDGTLTDRGAAELTAARSAVSAATAALTEGMDDTRQAIVREVLDEVRRRANALLDR